MSAPEDPPEHWTAVINPAAGRGRGHAQLPHISDALGSVDTDVQAWLRASTEKSDKGGDAARAALSLVRLKRRLQAN